MSTKSKITPVQLLGIWVALIAVIGGFVAILSLVDSTGITPGKGLAEYMWSGFVLLLIITAADRHGKDYLPFLLESTIGGVCGILTAYLMSDFISQSVGTPAVIAFMVIVVVAVSCTILGKFHMISNTAFMVYLTVGTAHEITHVSAHVNYAMVIILAGLYFGAIIHFGMKAIDKAQNKNSPAT